MQSELNNNLIMQWLHILSGSYNTWNTSNYPIATKAYCVYGCLEGNISYTITDAESCNTSSYSGSKTSFKWIKKSGNFIWIFVIGTI